MDHDTLIHDAADKLRAYLQTGCEGFYRQAWDRLRAANFGVTEFEAASEHHADLLLDHLRLHFSV